MIRLTKEEYEWLSSHGDRDYEDVLVDKKGKYVKMADGFGKQVKVYLPNGKDLSEM